MPYVGVYVEYTIFTQDIRVMEKNETFNFKWFKLTRISMIQRMNLALITKVLRGNIVSENSIEVKLI